MSTFKLPVEQVGLERSIQKAMDQFNRKPLKINVDDRSFTQPLGRITGAADEFTKSIEASNARVVAFGASVAVINSVKDAFTQLVVQTIKVEKALADINVVMGTSAQNLDKFGNSLFKIAKNTAQSFDSVASAATEFARQGLSMEETLKRTNDALVLTRLTGMKAADSVKGLTAAINAFGEAGLTTANIMNKLAAVDMAFAVSSEDLIDGLSRASAVAQDAGMNIDQLIGAITAAQQITARGGAVIGNSFKTIFTRIQRPQTIEQLEMLGVAVKDMQGNVIPAIKILENLAKTYDTLSQSQQSNIAQLVGGMFQINTLKAAMRDLGKENSITARAIQISSGATDEAIQKNEQLNKTLDALLTKTGLSLQKLAEQIGSITVGPGIEKILKAVNGLADGISNVLDGDSIGSNFANGFLKGIGNIISGPGAVLILGLVGKLFVDVAKFAQTSIANFMGMTSEAQKQKAVQESILNLLRSNHEVVGSLIGQGQTKRQQEQVILDLIVKQTAAQREQVKLAQHLSRVAVNIGANENLIIPERGARRSSSGYIPNFNAKQRERSGAIAGGYAPGSVKSMDMPSGQMVIYNTAEKVKKVPGFQDPFINPPLDSRAGKNHRQKALDMHGLDPYANKGFIPNFSKMTMKKYLEGFDRLKPEEKEARLQGLTDRIGRNEISMAGAQNMPTDIYMAAQRGKKIKDANAVASKQARREADDARRMKIDGTGYATLIPQINRVAAREETRIGTFKSGSNTYPYSLSNLYVAGPKSPSTGATTNPEENNLEDSVSRNIFKSSAQFSNAIRPSGTQGVNSSTIKKKLESTPGGKGAVGAAVGAAFEAAVAQAYGIDSAMSAERGKGDFDVNLSNTSKSPGTMNKVRQLFGIPSSISRMDFKASAEKGTFDSMAKKIFNDNRQHYLSQIGQTAASGFIPSFAKDHPLIEAIKREQQAGLPLSKIRINQSSKLKDSGNPLGLAVTNTRDEPRGMRDVPNFAKEGGVTRSAVRGDFGSSKVVNNFAKIEASSTRLSENLQKMLKRWGISIDKQRTLTKETVMLRLAQSDATKEETKEVLKQLGFEKEKTALGKNAAKEALKQIQQAREQAGNPMQSIGMMGRARQGVMNMGGRFAERFPRATSGMQRVGQSMDGFGMMIGLPMAGGFIDQGTAMLMGGRSRAQQTGTERFFGNLGSNIGSYTATGAMLGGTVGTAIAPGVGTAIGTAIGAGGGAITGLMMSLTDVKLSVEELTEATQDASSRYGEIEAAITKFQNLDITKGRDSFKAELESIFKDVGSGRLNSKNQTFGEAMAAAGGNRSAQNAVMKEFRSLSKRDLDNATIMEAMVKFEEQVDSLSFLEEIGLDSFFGKDSMSQSQIKAMGGALRNANLDEAQANRAIQASRATGSTSAYGRAEMMTKELGFDRDIDDAAFENITNIIEDIIDQDGLKALHEAIRASVGEGKKIEQVLEQKYKEGVNTFKEMQTLKKSMQRAALKSKTALAFLETDIKIKNDLEKIKLNYIGLSASTTKRLNLEEENLKQQAKDKNLYEKTVAISEARIKVQTDILSQLKSEFNQITPEKAAQFQKDIENANEQTLMTLLEAPEKIEKMLGLEAGSLAFGNASQAITDFVASLKERQSVLETNLKIENEIIENSMKSKEYVTKENALRSQINNLLQIEKTNLDSRVSDLDIRAVREKGDIERSYMTPFDNVDPVKQQLLELEKRKKIEQNQLKYLNEKLTIELDKQVMNSLNTKIAQDALIKSNSGLKATISQNDARIQVLTDSIDRLINELGGDGPTGPKPVEGGPSDPKKIQQQKDLNRKTQELQNLKNERANLQNNSGAPSQKSDWSGLQFDNNGFLMLNQPNPFTQQLNSSNKLMTGPGGTYAGQWDQSAPSTAPNTQTDNTEKIVAIDAQINQLTKEIANSQAKIESAVSNGIKNNTVTVSAESQIPISAESDLLAQISALRVPEGEIGEKIQNAIDQSTSRFIKNQEGFQQATGIDPKTINSFEDFEKELTVINNKFPELATEIVNSRDSIVQIGNATKLQSATIEDNIKTIDKQSENAKKAGNILNQLADNTQKANRAIMEAKARGDTTAAANLALDQQMQYDMQNRDGKAVMRASGMRPMTRRDMFLSGVSLNDNDVKTSETRFYKSIGRDLPRTFADNMAKALTEAGAGIKSWKEAFQDVALSFLNTLNQAIQRRLSDQILGVVNTGINSIMGPGFSPFSKGGVVRRSGGGEVYGGSGTKDDVPAMLNSGEYVIRKSAVNKYGKDFLTSINSGTVKQRNQGGTVGPADPNRELENQTGEGGFLISSLGQAGTFEAGNIEGRDNLMAFAKQTGTSGALDVIQSTGAIDDYGQAMPASSGGGINMQLEDESSRLSGLGLISGPVADEVMQAKQQALDAVGAYDRNVEALRKYREQKKKAIKDAIKGVLIGAAISAGLSAVQGAVQSTQMAKASNTVAIQGEATNLAIKSAPDMMGPPSPAQVGSFTDTAAGNLGFSSGDFYSKGGSFDIAKANSRFAMNGINNPQAYIQMTGGSGGGNTRGSTSFTKNLFSRGQNATNARFQGSGFQVNSMGAVSQRTGFFGGFKGANLNQGIGGGNTVGNMINMQGTNWMNSGGTGMMGLSAASNFSTGGGFSSSETATKAGFNSGTYTNYQSQRLLGKRKMAVGGKVIRASGESEDRVPALLTGGEFVVNKDAVKKHGLSFFNSINAQRLNKGGVVGKNIPMPAASNMDSQSELLQQILDTLITQGETAESTRSETQTLKETIESKTTNNITTGESGEANTNQSAILQSILEEIKNQNTTISQEISNSVQNVIDKSQTSESTEINNSSRSNSSSVRNSSNVSNVSNSSNFVEQASIQNDLLSQILIAVQSSPSSGGGGFSPSGGGSSGGGGVGDVYINVTVDSKGGSSSSYEGGSDSSTANGTNTSVNDQADNIAKQIEEAVIKVITDQQRLGGILQK
jgi:TP901 family phage tail tape measure protein